MTVEGKRIREGMEEERRGEGSRIEQDGGSWEKEKRRKSGKRIRKKKRNERKKKSLKSKVT